MPKKVTEAQEYAGDYWTIKLYEMAFVIDVIPVGISFSVG